MHVALVVDEERILREHAMLNRLGVGLLDANVNVSWVVPERFAADVSEVAARLLSVPRRITYAPHVLPWQRKRRCQEVVEALEKGPPDLVFAMGQEAWSCAMDVGRDTDRPVVLDIWRAGQVRDVPRGRHAQPIGAYIAPTEPIGESLRRVVDPDLVAVVPFGVAIADQPRNLQFSAAETVSVGIIGAGRDVTSFAAVLGGINRLLQEIPQLFAFLELRGPHEHEIWREVRKLDLLGSVTSMPDAARFRALLTRCNVLMMPERYGEVRSLALEAMSLGVPVVAADDPFLDYLIDGETALVVKEPEPSAWAAALRKLISANDLTADLTTSARQHVAREHRSSLHVQRLLEVFERILHGATVPFQEPVP